jgi:hypothetical protein
MPPCSWVSRVQQQILQALEVQLICRAFAHCPAAAGPRGISQSVMMRCHCGLERCAAPHAAHCVPPTRSACVPAAHGAASRQCMSRLQPHRRPDAPHYVMNALVLPARVRQHASHRLRCCPPPPPRQAVVSASLGPAASPGAASAMSPTLATPEAAAAVQQWRAMRTEQTELKAKLQRCRRDNDRLLHEVKAYRKVGGVGSDLTGMESRPLIPLAPIVETEFALPLLSCAPSSLASCLRIRAKSCRRCGSVPMRSTSCRTSWPPRSGWVGGWVGGVGGEGGCSFELAQARQLQCTALWCFGPSMPPAINLMAPCLLH